MKTKAKPKKIPAPASDDHKKVIEEKLSTFLSCNGNAKISIRDKVACVENPWGDSTLRLLAKKDDEALFEALNNVVLPPRFTGIWHADTKDLEIIWTAFPIGQEFKNRSFSFKFGNAEFKCEFGESSKRLMAIALNFQPAAAATVTNHRNLDSFRRYQIYAANKEQHVFITEWKPKSFWVRGIDWDESLTIDMARHLNFFMYYFDRETPRILIHDEALQKAEMPEALRFPFDAFPATIRGLPVDRNLLGLWESAVDASDIYRRFLYYYQILEYAAFYYLDDKSLKQVKKILASPQCVVGIDESARQVMDLMIDSKLSDEAKIVAMINQMVDPKELWKELLPYKNYFSSEMKFDGGFCLPPLIKSDWEVDDFLAAWTPKFPDALRKIRNALVHAREARMVNIISPSNANYDRLRPWIAPLALASMQAMIFRDA